MVKEINEAGEKKFMVMYEKKKTGYIEKDHVHLEKKAKIQLQKKKAVMNNNVTQKMQEKKVEVFRTEFEKPRDRKKRKFQNIAMAVQMANKRENLVTDKFLQDVESLVSRFETELNKMQELFGNILQKLPQGSLDVSVTSHL